MSKEAEYKLIDLSQAPNWVTESLKTFGSLTVKVGDIIEHLICCPQDILEEGEPAIQKDLDLVSEIKPSVVSKDIPFVTFHDYDERGGFATGGTYAVGVTPDYKSAIIPRVEIEGEVVRAHKIIAHVEDRQEYLIFRRKHIGSNTPAGYIRHQGTPQETTLDQVCPAYGFKFKLS